MIMKNFKSVCVAVIALFGATLSYSQCDTIATICEKHITDEFISDAQTYRALLSGDDAAEFTVTLFGGNVYRIAACSGTTDGNLVFRIVDSEKNILFTNSDYSTSPYWDFSVENTMQVTIEATLNSNNTDSGCAVILIGFKK
jgi:hypothetical protein